MAHAPAAATHDAPGDRSAAGRERPAPSRRTNQLTRGPPPPRRRRRRARRPAGPARRAVELRPEAPLAGAVQERRQRVRRARCGGGRRRRRNPQERAAPRVPEQFLEVVQRERPRRARHVPAAGVAPDASVVAGGRLRQEPPVQQRLVRDAVPAPRVAQGPRGHLFQVPRAAGQAPGVQEPVGLRAGGVVGADARPSGPRK